MKNELTLSVGFRVVSRTGRALFTIKVLISGASIAGNALAWWWGHAGLAVTVVERAAAFRDGSQNVGLRGVGRTVTAKLHAIAAMALNESGIVEQGI